MYVSQSPLYALVLSVIPSRISQNFYQLSLSYSHAIAYFYSLIFSDNDVYNSYGS